MPYKISGTTTDNADIHVFEDGSYLGKKSITAGSYDATFDSATASGITAVAEKSDGEVVGFGAVVATTTSGAVDVTGGSTGIFKSIQQIDITIPSGDIETPQSINAVDVNKSFIMFNGSSSYETYHGFGMVTLELSNSTTVTAKRYGDLYGTLSAAYVKGCVMEFESGVKSLQRGTVELPEDPGFSAQVVDETISAVDLAKTFVAFSDRNDNASPDSHEDNRVTVDLIDSTTLRITRNSQWKNYLHSVYYEIVEME